MRIKIATEKKYEQQTKGFTHTEIGIGYIYFIERYISFCINCHQNEIQELRPLLDYISTNMSDYFNIDYYKKLNKAINNEIEGFETICSSDEIREKIYDYIVITDKGEIFTPSVRDDYFDKTTIHAIS